MAIITISRGCYSHGKEIAQRTAQKLGYECVSREILIEASRFFNIPERKLLQSIHDAPTILERITHGKEKYLSYIEAAIFEHVRKGETVYHGHAGHLLLRGFPKVLKVRIIADMETRISMLMAEKKCSYNEAAEYIEKDDEERINWTKYLYKKDVSHPELYDIVIKIGGITIDDAADIIVDAAKNETFQLDADALRKIDDLAIESHLKALLTDVCEADEIKSNNGWVHVKCKPQRVRKFAPVSPKLEGHIDESIKDDLAREVKGAARSIPGVAGVDCVVESSNFK